MHGVRYRTVSRGRYVGPPHLVRRALLNGCLWTCRGRSPSGRPAGLSTPCSLRTTFRDRDRRTLWRANRMLPRCFDVSLPTSTILASRSWWIAFAGQRRRVHRRQFQGATGRARIRTRVLPLRIRQSLKEAWSGDWASIRKMPVACLVAPRLFPNMQLPASAHPWAEACFWACDILKRTTTDGQS